MRAAPTCRCRCVQRQHADASRQGMWQRCGAWSREVMNSIHVVNTWKYTPTLQCSLPETLHRCEHTSNVGSTVQGMIFARAVSLDGRWESWEIFVAGSTRSQSRNGHKLSHTRKNQTITITPITTARLFNCRNSRWWILCLVVKSVTDEELNTRQNKTPRHVTQVVRAGQGTLYGARHPKSLLITISPNVSLSSE